MVRALRPDCTPLCLVPNRPTLHSPTPRAFLLQVASEHPLGLTVHTLPEARGAMDAAQRTRHGRLKMLGVLLVCAAPVIASYFTYYVIRPEGRRELRRVDSSHNGHQPAMAATTLEGGDGALVDLKGQWLLVSVADSQCDTDCQKHLYLQRQLRESVGREKDHVDWVWLVTDSRSPPGSLEPALKQAQVRRMDETALARWLAPAAGQALRDHIYVVEPRATG